MKRLIREYLLENWTLKLTALLLALILWLFVRSEPGLERVIHGVPIEVQLPMQMEITREDPTAVEVTVRGAALSDLLLSQPVPTTCMIDLSQAKEGEHIITLTPENVKISRGSGIEVVQVNPSRVTLVLERTLSKEVPITIPIRGEPADGFEIYARSSKPATAVISGPRSHIEPLLEVSTEAVSISKLKQNAKFMVGLNIEDDAVRASITNPVQVDIEIGPRRRLFTVSQVPLAIDDPSYATSPRKISVHILAPIGASDEILPANFNAFVSTRNLNLSTLPVRVKPIVTILSNPGGALVIKDISPAEVFIQKKRKGSG